MPSKNELVTPATIHIGFENPGEVGFREVSSKPLNQGEGFVETNLTLISPGTETHDLFHGDKYPKRTVGYAQSGVLTQLNSRSKLWHEGDRVATNYGHATGHTVDLSEKNRSIKLPDWLNDEQGALVPQLFPIAVAGVIHLADQLNNSKVVKEIPGSLKDKEVVLIGGGPIGLLTGAVAKVAEAGRVILIDNNPDRLVRAEKLGIETINYSEVEGQNPVPVVKEMLSNEKILYGFNLGSGADGVINTANSGYAVNGGYEMLHDSGVFVEMAYHIGELRGVHKGGRFHTGGVTEQSGYVNKLRPHQRQRWSKHNMAKAGIDILYEMGDTIQNVLITHEGTFTQAQTIYERIQSRSESDRVITLLRPGDLAAVSRRPWEYRLAA